MPSERTIWLGATTVTISILLLMMLQARPERRGRPDVDDRRDRIWTPVTMCVDV